ncbi:hypothetical protein SBP28_002414 [Candidozyma auris]
MDALHLTNIRTTRKSPTSTLSTMSASDPISENGVSNNTVAPELSSIDLKREESPPVKKIKTEEASIPKHTEPPVHEIVGGSSIRQYLNKHLTQHLLEGLKQVGKDKPEDPLLALGKFLIQRSEDLKGECNKDAEGNAS